MQAQHTRVINGTVARLQPHIDIYYLLRYYHIPLTAFFPGQSWVRWHQKGKPFRILLEQEMIGWTICKSFALRSRQITTPAPHHSVFAGWMPFLPPNVQRQSTKLATYSASVVKSNLGNLGYKSIYTPWLRPWLTAEYS